MLSSKRPLSVHSLFPPWQWPAWHLKPCRKQAQRSLPKLASAKVEGQYSDVSSMPGGCTHQPCRNAHLLSSCRHNLYCRSKLMISMCHTFSRQCTGTARHHTSEAAEEPGHTQMSAACLAPEWSRPHPMIALLLAPCRRDLKSRSQMQPREQHMPHGMGQRILARHHTSRALCQPAFWLQQEEGCCSSLEAGPWCWTRRTLRHQPLHLSCHLRQSCMSC